MLYTMTLLVYPALTTSTLSWITTNTSAKYTTKIIKIDSRTSK